MKTSWSSRLGVALPALLSAWLPGAVAAERAINSRTAVIEGPKRGGLELSSLRRLERTSGNQVTSTASFWATFARLIYGFAK